MLSKSNSKLVTKKTLIPFIVLTSCFAWWGLANNMTDTLLAAFKKILSMSDFQTSWIQLAFYGSYFCLALPAAIFIKKYSYKAGVLLGLGLFIFGSLLFYPASITMNYFHFLLALYILAGGCSILETSVNPYILKMGPEDSATRRLNLAQSFNPIGSILGVLISKLFILSNLNNADAVDRAEMNDALLNKIQSDELSAVMGPYVAVAFVLIMIWLAIAFIKMPKASENGGEISLVPTFKRLIKIKNYTMGVVTQFFYVGAQIGVWSFTIRYAMKELQINEEAASSYYLASLVLFAISRFVSTWLMRFVTPPHLLFVLSSLASIFTIGTILLPGHLGVYSLIAISGCMSLMFPTIFSLSVQGLGEDTKIAGSGLIMAILGGAVITAVQGLVSDFTGKIELSFIVPLCCFGVILYYAHSVQKGKLIVINK